MRMKKRKKRIHVQTILLAVILIVLTVCSLLIQMNQNGKKKLEKLSRGFYSGNIEKVNINEAKGKNVARVLSDTLSQGESGLIFKINLVQGKDVRGVCYRGDVEKPLLLRGRFFTEQECFGDEALAVAGRDYESQISEDGFLETGGVRCRVIGILGSREESRYDQMCLVNMTAALQMTDDSGTYVFDGSEAETIIGQSGFFADAMEKCGDDVYYSHKETLGFQTEEEAAQSVAPEDTLRPLYLAMTASFVLAALAGTMFWCQKKRRRYQVESFLGAGGLYIAGHFLRDYLLLWLISYGIGFGIAEILRAVWIPYELFAEDVIKSVVLTLAPGLVVVLVYGVFLMNSYGQLKKVPVRFPVMNLMLAAQFACFFWLFCQVFTYYVNISTETWVVNAKNGYQYYSLYEASNDNIDIDDDPLHIDNIKEALKEVKACPEFTFMALNTQDSGCVKKKTIQERFRDSDIDEFLDGNMYTGYYKLFPDRKPDPLYEDVDGEDQAAFSVCRMDENAFNHYIKKAGEGRLFNKEDYKISVHEKELPVVLGYGYTGHFQVGDTFSLRMTKPFTVKVIGILPEDTKYISDATLERGNECVSRFDYTIILPYFDIEGEAETSVEKMFLEENYYNYLQGTLVFDGDVSPELIARSQNRVNEIFVSHSLYTVAAINAGIGVRMFMKETRQSVNIVMSLLLIMAVFGIISLCISLISKLNQKMERYGIELLNGQSIGRIIRNYVLEIVVVMLVAALISGYSLRYYIMQNIVYGILLALTMIVVLIPAMVVMIVKIRRIDVEELLCKMK